MKEKTLLIKLKYLKRLLQIRQNPSLESIKDFVKSFYGVKDMPQEFYELLVKNQNIKKIIKSILHGNIYTLISDIKNNGEPTEDIETYITPQKYFQISKKRINKIMTLLFDMSQDKNTLNEVIEEEIQWKLRRRPTYQQQEYQEIAYKLYQCLGYENTLELLSQKFGNINYEQVYYMANNLEPMNILPAENDILINYLFGNKAEPNNPIRQMLSGRFTELFINFDYLCNNTSYFVNKLGTKLKSDKLKALLRERFLTSDPAVPEITADIKEDMLSSYYHTYRASATAEEEVIDINTNTYVEKLRNKYKSSIPQIKFQVQDEITPELLALSDPRNLTHGYRSGNCFRLNGDASILFSQFLESENMRILSFSTNEYKDYAMVLIMRNGNVLIAQGIETSKWVPQELKGRKLYDTTKAAMKEIMDYMNTNGDEIVATIIGATNENVANYNNKILPFLISPILENGNNYYNGISSYQCLLDVAPGKTSSDIKLYEPEKRYYDERETVLTTHKNEFDSTIEKRMIALRFQRTKTSEGFSFYQEMSNKQESKTICNKDWYITLFTDGTIDSYLADTTDPRAEQEYKEELAKVYQKKA